jgi:hypothetical protein
MHPTNLRRPIIEPGSNMRLLRPVPTPDRVYDQDTQGRHEYTLALTDVEWALLVATLRRPDQATPVHDLGITICSQLAAAARTRRNSS